MKNSTFASSLLSLAALVTLSGCAGDTTDAPDAEELTGEAEQASSGSGCRDLSNENPGDKMLLGEVRKAVAKQYGHNINDVTYVRANNGKGRACIAGNPQGTRMIFTAVAAEAQHSSETYGYVYAVLRVEEGGTTSIVAAARPNATYCPVSQLEKFTLIPNLPKGLLPAIKNGCLTSPKPQ